MQRLNIWFFKAVITCSHRSAHLVLGEVFGLMLKLTSDDFFLHSKAVNIKMPYVASFHSVYFHFQNALYSVTVEEKMSFLV